MILYTVMPEEFIFPTANDDYQKQKMIEVDGISMLVNEVNPGEHYVVRVMSSNPQEFLNDQYTPGQRVTLM